MKLATTLLGFCVASLLMMGTVMLYSSSMVQVGSRYLVMQLVWGGLGIVSCVAMASLDYRHLKKISWVLFGVAVLLLVAVLIPGIGRNVNGARRWIGFSGVNFQPSELGKIALIIALAHYAELNQRNMGKFVQGLIIPGAGIAVVLGLIFKEPDYGTTMLLASVSAVMLFIAGLRWRYIIPPIIAGTVAISLAIFNNPVRMKRILAWLDPEANKEGVGFQSYQAMVALGAGGVDGLGLANGRQKMGFVPEHHTDFIFSIIGEELGLIATIAVVLLFVLLVICGLYVAWHACDGFGTYLGCGITCLIGLQAFINIGVVTSALPNKGLPLPFISYGGSNLLMMLTAVGLLLSIARRATVRERTRENPFSNRELTATQVF